MTLLAKQHGEAGATMGECGGCLMPLHYGSVLQEAGEALSVAGVFDISHLGRIRIRSAGSMNLLKRVCTADVVRQEDDTALMTLLCDDAGGIIDICCLLRLEGFWLMTCSAGNSSVVMEHLRAQQIDDVQISDQTSSTAHFAVTGPAAENILDTFLPVSLSEMGRMSAKTGTLMMARYIAARTGETSAWSLEVTIPALFASKAWNYITKRVRPCGQIARDILRHQAGLPKWGYELNRTIDPVTAGLMSMVDTGRDFIGARAIADIAGRCPSRKRVILELSGSLPASGDMVTGVDDEDIGVLTSCAPSLSDGLVAQALVDSRVAVADNKVSIMTSSGKSEGRIKRVCA